VNTCLRKMLTDATDVYVRTYVTDVTYIRKRFGDAEAKPASVR